MLRSKKRQGRKLKSKKPRSKKPRSQKLRSKKLRSKELRSCTPGLINGQIVRRERDNRQSAGKMPDSR